MAKSLNTIKRADYVKCVLHVATNKDKYERATVDHVRAELSKECGVNASDEQARSIAKDAGVTLYKHRIGGSKAGLRPSTDRVRYLAHCLKDFMVAAGADVPDGLQKLANGKVPDDVGEVLGK